MLKLKKQHYLLNPKQNMIKFRNYQKKGLQKNDFRA